MSGKVALARRARSFLISRRELMVSISALALLDGCGGDGGSTASSVPAGTAASTTPTPSPAPTPAPTPSPTPTPTPTPTPSPTPIPTPTPPPVPVGTLIVQAGDSIGAGPPGYAAIDHLGFDDSVIVRNVSFAGGTMQSAYYNRVYNYLGLYDPTRTSVLLIQIGTNDLGTTRLAGADLYAGTAALFVAASQAAGFYVVLNTILPRIWATAQENERLAYNRLVRANSAGADAINDVAADGVIGDGVDPSNSPYYADGLHPTVLGQQRLAQLDAAALKPFLRRPIRVPTG